MKEAGDSQAYTGCVVFVPHEGTWVNESCISVCFGHLIIVE